jgi:hypothetical protein
MTSPRFHAVRLARLLAAVACLTITGSMRLDAAPKPATAPSTNEVVAAQSIFVIPTSPQEGRDPFYPRSTRIYAAQVVAVPTNQTTAVAAPVSLDLRLNGISGTAAQPLAIINNRTFGVGEQGEVITTTGRAHIRCLEIRKDTVIVQAPGETKILRLRPAMN